jgi:hypothetical protein
MIGFRLLGSYYDLAIWRKQYILMTVVHVNSSFVSTVLCKTWEEYRSFPGLGLVNDKIQAWAMAGRHLDSIG